MSSNLSFYVGAFIEFPSIIFTKEVKTNRCSNIDCKNHHSNFNEQVKFCSNCGNSIENYLFKKDIKRHLCIQDLNNIQGNTVEWSDILASISDLNIIISNKKDNTGIIYDTDNTTVNIINPEDVNKIKELFTEQITKIGLIELLQKNFNFTPKVEFGTFATWL